VRRRVPLQRGARYRRSCTSWRPASAGAPNEYAATPCGAGPGTTCTAAARDTRASVLAAAFSCTESASRTSAASSARCATVVPPWRSSVQARDDEETSVCARPDAGLGVAASPAVELLEHLAIAEQHVTVLVAAAGGSSDLLPLLSSGGGDDDLRLAFSSDASRRAGGGRLSSLLYAASAANRSLRLFLAVPRAQAREIVLPPACGSPFPGEKDNSCAKLGNIGSPWIGFGRCSRGGSFVRLDRSTGTTMTTVGEGVP
jgi:hypothetical protein